jgi:hypothetical protein
MLKHHIAVTRRVLVGDRVLNGTNKFPPKPPRCHSCARPMQLLRRTSRFGGLPDLYSFYCVACDEWHVEEGGGSSGPATRSHGVLGSLGQSARVKPFRGHSRSDTMRKYSASGMCLGNSDPGGIPSPDTPTPPGAQSLQAEATTRREPRERGLPGVLLCGGSTHFF